MTTATRVILLPSPPCATSPRWPALRRKRRTLWRNAARNLLVARVAAACLARDRKALKEMGVPCTRKKSHGGAPRVVILVESTEHAQALGALLPGWEVLDAVPTLDVEEEPEDEEESGRPPGRVVTWMHATYLGVRADVLVRATGWRGRLGLGPGDRWVEPYGRLLVVDFDDAWDERAETDTQAPGQGDEAQGLRVIRSDENKTTTA